jgi:hypothetical protein
VQRSGVNTIITHTTPAHTHTHAHTQTHTLMHIYTRTYMQCALHPTSDTQRECVPVLGGRAFVVQLVGVGVLFVCMHTIYIYTCVHSDTHSLTHTHTERDIRRCIQIPSHNAHIHMHTYTHAFILTQCTHAHTHIHIHMYKY